MIIEGIFQAEHWKTVFDTCKFFKRGPADPLAWRILGDKIREVFFDIEQFTEKKIIFTVSYERIVQDVILVIMELDFLNQILDSFFGCSAVEHVR